MATWAAAALTEPAAAALMQQAPLWGSSQPFGSRLCWEHALGALPEPSAAPSRRFPACEHNRKMGAGCLNEGELLSG